MPFLTAKFFIEDKIVISYEIVFTEILAIEVSKLDEYFVLIHTNLCQFLYAFPEICCYFLPPCVKIGIRDFLGVRICRKKTT